MENPETNNKKIPVGTNLAPDVFAVVQNLATEEERPMSNMVERLLKQSPRVAERLGAAETATATVGG